MDKKTNKNILWHEHLITYEDRVKLNGHMGACLWFTGLSGSGKSTLASSVEKELYNRKIHTYLLDGDNIRHGLSKDLGFSNSDRVENIRRIGEVVKLFVDSANIVLTAFISPFGSDRENVRNLLSDRNFIEIFVKCPIEICEQRDPKGLYKKARESEIKNFSGISSSYEEPVNPELIIDNSYESDFNDNVEKIINYMKLKKILY
ncbi:MAG: adenylyl-sulfate kinase [Ignavibacteriae bacterium]|nr:adenylyl-sulfate kinase [Ignavibacteriota bacterium]NOG98620.1 adenylyl-sulfate kinase [Ignavibacteriota bacterium]